MANTRFYIFDFAIAPSSAPATPSMLNLKQGIALTLESVMLSEGWYATAVILLEQLRPDFRCGRFISSDNKVHPASLDPQANHLKS